MNTSITSSKIYRFLRIILNLAFWIGLSLIVVFLVLSIIYPDLAAKSFLSFDGFTLSAETVLIVGPIHFLFIASLCIAAVLGIFSVYFLRNIVNSLREQSPFTHKNVARIRIIGLLLFCQAYMKQLSYYLFACNVAQSNIQPRFNFIPEGAILAICVLVLAEIFRFGCTLQYEHDTTV